MKKAVDSTLAFLLGLIVLIMFAQVVFRYLLNNSLSWSEELIRFLFVWLTFLGGAIAIRDKSHIAVEFFVERLPEKYYRTIRIINAMLIVVFTLAIIIIGVLWMYHSRELRSSALGLPVYIVLYGALPATSLLGLYYSIQQVWEEWKGSKTKDN